MLLFSPCTTSANVAPNVVNVGAEGVCPLSRVQPENTPVVELMLLNQSVVPPDPVTTVYRVSPMNEAAGLSIVVPEGSAVQPVQDCVAIV